MRKLPQIISLIVSQLPSGPRFSILGIAFPLAGLIRILLQSEDGFCCRCGESFVGEREVGAFRFALVVLENIDVDWHSQGVGIKPLDGDRKGDGINGVGSQSALFNMFEKSGGDYIGVECGGVKDLSDPNVIDDLKDEGGGAVDSRVVEGLILYPYFPDGLKYLGLVHVVFQYESIGIDTHGRGECLAVLCCVGVNRGDDSPLVVLGMGLFISHLEENGGDGIADVNYVVMGGIPCDWDEGLSGLRQLEGEIFG